VSNYSLKQVDVLIAETGVAPAVCQLAWSPPLFDAKLMAGFKQRKVVMSAHSPFRQSKLDDPVVEAIAARHGKTANQVIVRWNLQHGVAIVPKSSVPARMAGNADVFDFELNAAEMSELDACSAL
jgi:diketogulonate reductase-like aldo/keto reductase